MEEIERKGQADREVLQMDVLKIGNPSADTVLIQPAGDHEIGLLEKEAASIKELTGRDFCLTAVKVDDWNAQLSPWEAPAVFGEEGFAGKAAHTLSKVQKLCQDRSRSYYIGGYSLAGLFALWTVCRTDLFRGAAAASPSVWFPGFTDFVKTHEIKSRIVYLSLGDKEERTRNPVMAAVGEKIRLTYELLRERNIDCTLEWNPGNHFQDAELRTAKAFAWVMGRCGADK